MAPLISANVTGVPSLIIRCIGDAYNNPRCYYMKFSPNDDQPMNILHVFKCAFWRCLPNTYEPNYPDNNRETERFNSQYLQGSSSTSTTLKPPKGTGSSEHDAILQFVAFKILLPIVMVLIAICFVLGVILIVKSYMMAPLKQNLATAIRRRRRFGHAPDNNYIPPAEMRASHRLNSISDRKSLPPPEVLIAARERASQLLAAQAQRASST